LRRLHPTPRQLTQTLEHLENLFYALLLALPVAVVEIELVCILSFLQPEHVALAVSRSPSHYAGPPFFGQPFSGSFSGWR
jgi:hypothetical protein